MPRSPSQSVSRRPSLDLRIIIHRKALHALAVNPCRHYVSETIAAAAKTTTRDMTENLDPETGFLEQLGQRVRTMRALRGMSRKVLAKVSGISERYIAQLESGKGNVSIVLLRRVSNAMGAHLEDLIPATEAGARLACDPRPPAQGDAGPDRAGQGRAVRPGPRRIGASDLVFRHCPDRPARRRQVHPRQDAGEEDRLELCRAEQGDRSGRTDCRSPRSSRSTARKGFGAWSRPRSANCWRGKS